MILPATSSMTMVQKLAIKTTKTALTTSLRIARKLSLHSIYPSRLLKTFLPVIASEALYLAWYRAKRSNLIHNKKQPF
jgi:hypothetical protein